MRDRERALYERIIALYEERVERLERYLGIRPTEEVAATVAAVAPELPVFRAFDMDEDVEDLDFAVRSNQIGADEAERILERFGFENTAIEDYTFRS